MDVFVQIKEAFCIMKIFFSNRIQWSLEAYSEPSQLSKIERLREEKVEIY